MREAVQTDAAASTRSDSFPRGELLLASALALVIRLVYLAGAARSPLFSHPPLDASGDPIYGGFLAGIDTLAGHNPLAPRLAQALLDAASVFLIGVATHAMWVRRAAALAADVAAVYGPLVYFQGELLPATLDFFLIAILMCLAARAARAGSIRGIPLALLALALVAYSAWSGGGAGPGAGGAGAGTAAAGGALRILNEVALVWNRSEAPCGPDQRFFAAFNSLMFRLPWLLSFAFVGPVALVAAWTQRRRAPLMAGFLLCATIAIAIFHVCDRTRLPIVAGAIPLVGFGLDRFVTALSRAAAKARAWPGAAALAEVACAHGRTLIALGCAAVFVTAPFPSLHRAQPGPGWVTLARAHEAAGELVAARDAYASAERSGMKTADLYSSWGRVERKLGWGIQAEQHLLTAIGLDPGHEAAHETLGDIYFERGSYAQAAQEYAIAAGLDPPRAAELWTHAGESLEEEGKGERAAEMFERALRARPGYAAAEAGLMRLRGPGNSPAPAPMFPLLPEKVTPSSGR